MRHEGVWRATLRNDMSDDLVHWMKGETEEQALDTFFENYFRDEVVRWHWIYKRAAFMRLLH